MKSLLAMAFLLISAQSFAHVQYDCIGAQGAFDESFASGVLKFELTLDSSGLVLDSEESYLSFYKDFDATYKEIAIDDINFGHQEDVWEYKMKIDVSVYGLELNGQKINKTSATLDALCEVTY